MKRESFARGALVLMLAGTISKLLGAFYRMPLARIIGEEGIGLYEMAYPIYSLLLILAVAGFPVAISKLVSEKRASKNFEEEKIVFCTALSALSVTGIIFSIILYVGAEFISVNILGDYRVMYSLKIISPAIFFVSIMSGFRGYFQGLHLMTPTAISQVTEQFIRVFTMLFFGYLYSQAGPMYGAAGATLGAVTGAFFGLVLLIFLFVREKGISFVLILFLSRIFIKSVIKSGSTLFRLLKIAVPFSLGALVMPLMQTVDAAVVPKRLQLIGYSVSEATSLYGHLSGMALRLISLPTIVTLALGTSLIPVLSTYQVKGYHQKIKNNIEKALRLTLIIGIPTSVGIFLLAYEMTELMFGYYEAGGPLRVMAFASLFLCLHQVTSFMLQGLGYYPKPVINLFIGAILNFILNYNLTAYPPLGILGAAIGTGSGFFLASILNIKDLIKLKKLSINFFKTGFKPLIASAVMAVFLIRFDMVIDTFFAVDALNFILKVSIAGIVYFLTLLIFRGIEEEDLLVIPKVGDMLVRILKTLKLL
ncbi:putative polysaccharide biosynthesis protein [Natranaerofaba carboxydovora]|uniref:putative polysaccharide biosynthesis protein n=1 Tax=Natranaerofaba carboxydovora TaxID=2742683 RepID=UPI001F134335|nr:polysaccharide biosynthesis protein [Natranaerofaba carboxydovora]